MLPMSPYGCNLCLASVHVPKESSQRKGTPKTPTSPSASRLGRARQTACPYAGWLVRASLRALLEHQELFLLRLRCSAPTRGGEKSQTHYFLDRAHSARYAADAS